MGETYQSTVIDAPADRVWAVLRDFHDMSWADNVIEACEPVGDADGDAVGAGRILNDAFQETLREHSDDDRMLRYSIDDGPSPVSPDDVSEYVGTVRVRPVTEGDGTFVEWSSRWQGNEEETREFCHGIYTALLQELKRHFEG